MFKKRFLRNFSIFGVAAITSVTLASCSTSSALNFESSVQLVVSNSNSTLADQSFSESSYDGIRDFFKSVNANFELPEAKSRLIKDKNGLWKKPGDSLESRINTYKQVFNNNSDVVVATGFNQEEALAKIASTLPENQIFKNDFANNAFIFVDGGMSKGENTDPYNISSINYRADDGSFLAGISISVFLNKHQEYFKKDGKLSVSSFVGLAFPSTLNFFNGFRFGVHYWNKVLKPLIKYVDTDKKIETMPIHFVSGSDKGDNDLSGFISGSFAANETKATTLTKNMRNNGANVIFPIAGPQTALVVNEIKSNSTENNTKSIVLGVDTAQEDNESFKASLPNGEKIGSGNILQFSSIKNLRSSVKGVLKAIYNNGNGKNANDQDGYKGLGWNNIGSINNAGVGVSSEGLKYLINPNFMKWSAVSKSTSTTSSTSTQSTSTTVWPEISLSTLLSSSVAKNLDIKDEVISEYSKLLKGELLTGSQENIKKWNTSNSNDSMAKAAFDLINKTSAEDSKSMNGWDEKGKWSIENNEDNQNTYISLALSKYIPAIMNGDKKVKYSTPNSEAEFVGNDSKDHSEFYKKFVESSIRYKQL